MKKIIVIIMLYLLVGCEKESILNTVYISSIGIDYVDGEYIGYFYSPPTKDIGKNSDSDDDSTVYVIKDKELINLFDTMFDSDPIYINMFHLKTMILSDSFNNVNVLLDYFKYSDKLSYNFHVFISDDDLSEIYKYKSMSNISNLYNFLNSPSLINYEEHGISKCHFLNFANNYLNEYRYDIIPLVKIERNSLDEEEFQLKIDGYSNFDFIYQSKEYPGINFLYESNKEISIENNVIKLYDYKVDYIVKDNIYTILIKYKSINITGDLDIEYYIIESLNNYFDTLIENEGSIYLINQYNYLFKKNIDNTLININIM